MVKYNLEKINKIMEAHGYYKNVLNKHPTWLTEKTKEGLQINLKNELVSFVVESGEMNLTHSDSKEMEAIKREIQLSNEPPNKECSFSSVDRRSECITPEHFKIHTPEETPKPEQTKQPDVLKKDAEIQTTTTELKFINQLSRVFSGEQIIVPQNLKELAGMPLMDRLLLFQKTDKKFIRKRRGFLLPASARKDKKELTDSDYKMFSYVPANIMKMEANLAFGLQWSSEVETEKYFDSEVVVRGYVQAKINGELIRRPCGGSMIKKGLMDWGDALEGAISEMIKRGLYSFGFNADIKLGEFDEEEINKEI